MDVCVSGTYKLFDKVSVHCTTALAGSHKNKSPRTTLCSDSKLMFHPNSEWKCFQNIRNDKKTISCIQREFIQLVENYIVEEKQFKSMVKTGQLPD